LGVNQAAYHRGNLKGKNVQQMFAKEEEEKKKTNKK
jgi:hypothetical protein